MADDGDARGFADAVVETLDSRYVGNVAFTLIENGEVYSRHFTSIGNNVDGDTLFQVASLGKWVAAWGVMTLVEAGELDLDAPVSTYLTRWSLPPSDFDNDGVTVRRLLSHTAGLTDGLGYAGYPPDSEVRLLEASLTQANASPGNDGRVRVGREPGSEWIYSGGGYTLLQLIIEEVTQQSFESYMSRAVFEPLGMTRSTYRVDLEETPNVAEIYGVDGRPAVRYRFTSLAATSLYTSTHDLERLIRAHFPGPDGEPVGRGVLTPETVEMMREPHGFQMGAAIWGLGAILYAPAKSGGFIVGHDGNNEPAINSAARLDPNTGDGFIILETGNPMLATDLAGEWVWWKAGTADLFVFLSGLQNMIQAIIIGWGVIAFMSFFAARFLSRRRG